MSVAAVRQELILGHYRPLRPLGSGGMGHVWLARDERNGLDVALKIVPREGKAAVRAEREARAASALRHQRCQRIYALSRDSGHVYIAYEYIAGKTVRQALENGELNDRDVVEVGAQVLEALAHAHARRIVHRDVKPSNVLLADGDGIQVKLLDFGLAQMEEFDTLTAIGDVPGTLGYVSPERLVGKEATNAADIWAVGVMLWEGLAGRHPFRDRGLAKTTRKIKEGAPSLAEVRPDLPKPICAAVMSALELDPDRRPSADQLADRLRLKPAKKRGRAKKPAARVGEKTERAPLFEPRRVPAAALAAASAGWVTATIPFYPAHWPLLIAAVAAALAFVTPRIGLAFVLASLVLPLGNISLGLAALYGIIAVAWLALMWADAGAGLLVAASAVLAPGLALGLIPIIAQYARGSARRAVQAGAGVLVAAVVAGLNGLPLPFDGAKTPHGIGIPGSERPGAVAHALWGVLAAHPALLGEALVFAAAAALFSYARRFGLWGAAGYGSVLLVASVAVAPQAAVVPFVFAAWIGAGALAFSDRVRLPQTAVQAQ